MSRWEYSIPGTTRGKCNPDVHNTSNEALDYKSRNLEKAGWVCSLIYESYRQIKIWIFSVYVMPQSFQRDFKEVSSVKYS